MIKADEIKNNATWTWIYDSNSVVYQRYLDCIKNQQGYNNLKEKYSTWNMIPKPLIWQKNKYENKTKEWKEEKMEKI